VGSLPRRVSGGKEWVSGSVVKLAPQSVLYSMRQPSPRSSTRHILSRRNKLDLFLSLRPLASGFFLSAKSCLETGKIINIMWRKQHQEGPIDDRWTNLYLDVDEGTGELKIVESRKEWYLGSSRTKNTCKNARDLMPSRSWNLRQDGL
jgi:hypothetical protein